jgi:hypothetical protein
MKKSKYRRYKRGVKVIRDNTINKFIIFNGLISERQNI